MSSDLGQLSLVHVHRCVFTRVHISMLQKCVWGSGDGTIPRLAFIQTPFHLPV